MTIKNFCVGLLMTMSASVATAAPITVPAGLNTGDTYFLAFVTDGLHDALSREMLVYDAFVTSEANSEPALSALGTTWKVIGSTPGDDAVTHSGVTGPVYNLQGERVATGSADMFDGTLAAPILYNQHGMSERQTLVFTGSDQFGASYPTQELGGSSGFANFGHADAAHSLWIYDDGVVEFAAFALYGISGPLTVTTAPPEPVPEPASMLLLGAGLFGVAARVRRRQQF